MTIWAVVPVRSFARAKSRLASALSPDERADLAEAMLTDVLDLLTAVPDLGGVLVVTGDRRAAKLARGAGGLVLDDPAEAGLNMAVSAGQGRLREIGASGMLVVPADVPFTARGEVEAVLAALAGVSLVVVPASRDGGTNLLGMRPVDAIAPAYGPDSAMRHAALARSAGLPVRTLMLPGAGRDIDVAADLSPPPDGSPAPRTRAALLLPCH